MRTVKPPFLPELYLVGYLKKCVGTLPPRWFVRHAFEQRKAIRQNSFLFVELDGLFVPFRVQTSCAQTDKELTVELEDDNVYPLSDNLQPSLAVFMEREEALSHSSPYAALQFSDTEVRTRSTKLGRITHCILQKEDMRLLLIQNEKGEEITIPFHTDLIEKWDKEQRQLILNLPEGLI